MATACNEERVARLVAKLEATGRLSPAKPRLQVVGENGKGEPIELEAALGRREMIRRIQTLRKNCKLSWLVRQETAGASSLAALDEQALKRLLAFMERAAECPDYDVSYRDAGLLRSHGEVA